MWLKKQPFSENLGILNYLIYQTLYIDKKMSGYVRRHFAAQQGFTLIEMLIAVALGVLVLSGVMNVFISQQKAYSIQDQVSEMQQNARVGMDALTRDIRMAGYDPSGSKNFGFTDANFTNSDSAALALTTTTQIYLTNDDDGDGTIDFNTTECIAYRVNGNNLEKGTAIAGNNISTWTPIAENVTALTFTYVYADAGTSPPGFPDNSDGDDTNDLDDIRVVQISLTARTAKQDSGYTHPVNGDGYRTRTLTANVRVSNMGL